MGRGNPDSLAKFVAREEKKRAGKQVKRAQKAKLPPPPKNKNWTAGKTRNKRIVQLMPLAALGNEDAQIKMAQVAGKAALRRDDIKRLGKQAGLTRKEAIQTWDSALDTAENATQGFFSNLLEDTVGSIGNIARAIPALGVGAVKEAAAYAEDKFVRPFVGLAKGNATKEDLLNLLPQPLNVRQVSALAEGFMGTAEKSDYKRYPLVTTQGESFRATADRLTNPKELLKAYSERPVMTFMEDVGNAAILAGGAGALLKGGSMAGAAGRVGAAGRLGQVNRAGAKALKAARKMDIAAAGPLLIPGAAAKVAGKGVKAGRTALQVRQLGKFAVEEANRAARQVKWVDQTPVKGKKFRVADDGVVAVENVGPKKWRVHVADEVGAPIAGLGDRTYRVLDDMYPSLDAAKSGAQRYLDDLGEAGRVADDAAPVSPLTKHFDEIQAKLRIHGRDRVILTEVQRQFDTINRQTPKMAERLKASGMDAKTVANRVGQWRGRAVTRTLNDLQRSGKATPTVTEVVAGAEIGARLGKVPDLRPVIKTLQKAEKTAQKAQGKVGRTLQKLEQESVLSLEKDILQNPEQYTHRQRAKDMADAMPNLDEADVAAYMAGQDAIAVWMARNDAYPNIKHPDDYYAQADFRYTNRIEMRKGLPYEFSKGAEAAGRLLMVLDELPSQSLEHGLAMVDFNTQRLWYHIGHEIFDRMSNYGTVAAPHVRNNVGPRSLFDVTIDVMASTSVKREPMANLAITMHLMGDWMRLASDQVALDAAVKQLDGKMPAIRKAFKEGGDEGAKKAKAILNKTTLGELTKSVGLTDTRIRVIDLLLGDLKTLDNITNADISAHRTRWGKSAKAELTPQSVEAIKARQKMLEEDYGVPKKRSYSQAEMEWEGDWAKIRSFAHNFRRPDDPWVVTLDTKIARGGIGTAPDHFTSRKGGYGEASDARRDLIPRVEEALREKGIPQSEWPTEVVGILDEMSEKMNLEPRALRPLPGRSTAHQVQAPEWGGISDEGYRRDREVLDQFHAEAREALNGEGGVLAVTEVIKAYLGTRRLRVHPKGTVNSRGRLVEGEAAGSTVPENLIDPRTGKPVVAKGRTGKRKVVRDVPTTEAVQKAQNQWDKWSGESTGPDAKRLAKEGRTRPRSFRERISRGDLTPEQAIDQWFKEADDAIKDFGVYGGMGDAVKRIHTGTAAKSAKALNNTAWPAYMDGLKAWAAGRHQMSLRGGDSPHAMAAALLDQARLTEGFTYEIVGSSAPIQGYAYSPYPELEWRVGQLADATPDDILNFADHNAKILGEEGHYIGAWVDGDGRIVLDVSVVERDYDLAMSRAREAMQEEVYSIHDKTSISTGLTPEEVALARQSDTGAGGAVSSSTPGAARTGAGRQAAAGADSGVTARRMEYPYEADAVPYGPPIGRQAYRGMSVEFSDADLALIDRLSFPRVMADKLGRHALGRKIVERLIRHKTGHSLPDGIGQHWTTDPDFAVKAGDNASLFPPPPKSGSPLARPGMSRRTVRIEADIPHESLRAPDQGKAAPYGGHSLHKADKGGPERAWARAEGEILLQNNASYTIRQVSVRHNGEWVDLLDAPIEVINGKRLKTGERFSGVTARTMAEAAEDAVDLSYLMADPEIKSGVQTFLKKLQKVHDNPIRLTLSEATPTKVGEYFIESIRSLQREFEKVQKKSATVDPMTGVHRADPRQGITSMDFIDDVDGHLDEALYALYRGDVQTFSMFTEEIITMLHYQIAQYWPPGAMREKVTAMVDIWQSDGSLMLDLMQSGMAKAQKGPGGPQSRVYGQVVGPYTVADGRATLEMFKGGNLGMLMHENGHLLRHFLSEDDLAIVHRHYETHSSGPRAGKLTELGEEMFANDFINYMKEHRAPDPALTGAFARIREAVLELYKRFKELKSSDTIHPDIVALFDEALSGGQRARPGSSLAPLSTVPGISAVDSLPVTAGLGPLLPTSRVSRGVNRAVNAASETIETHPGLTWIRDKMRAMTIDPVSRKVRHSLNAAAQDIGVAQNVQWKLAQQIAHILPDQHARQASLVIIEAQAKAMHAVYTAAQKLWPDKVDDLFDYWLQEEFAHTLTPEAARIVVDYVRDPDSPMAKQIDQAIEWRRSAPGGAETMTDLYLHRGERNRFENVGWEQLQHGPKMILERRQRLQQQFDKFEKTATLRRKELADKVAAIQKKKKPTRADLDRQAVLKDRVKTAEAAVKKAARKISEFETSSKTDVRYAPARLRPAQVLNRKAKSVIDHVSSELDKMGLKAEAVEVRALLDSLYLTTDEMAKANLAGLFDDPQHVVHTHIGEVGQPGMAGKRRLPRTFKKARSERYRGGHKGDQQLLYRRNYKDIGRGNLDEFKKAVQVATANHLRSFDFVARLGRGPLEGIHTREGAIEAGWSPWDPDNLFETPPGTITNETLWIPRHVKNSFKTYFESNKFDELMKHSGYDALTRVFKIAVLPLSPAWQVGNAFGNTILATIGAGVPPHILLQEVIRAIREYKGSKVHGERDWTRGGVIPDRMFASGPTHSATGLNRARPGELMDISNADYMAGIDRLEPHTLGKTLAAPIRGGFWFNEFIDNVGRSAVFMHLKRKGYSDEMAVQMGLRAMGDFTHMTVFEQRYVRRVIPFYAWMRHITKLVWTMPLEHPLRTAWTLKLANEYGQPEEWVRALPDWMQSIVPVGGGVFLNPTSMVPFPTNPVEMFTDPGAYFTRAMNPVLKLASSNLWGLDPLTGRPYTRPPGTGKIDEYGNPKPTAPSILRQLRGIPPQLRLLDRLDGTDDVARYSTGDVVQIRDPKTGILGEIPTPHSKLESIGRFVGFPTADEQALMAQVEGIQSNRLRQLNLRQPRPKYNDAAKAKRKKKKSRLPSLEKFVEQQSSR